MPRRQTTNSQLLNKLITMDRKIDEVKIQQDQMKDKLEKMKITSRYRMYIISFSTKKFKHITNFFFRRNASYCQNQKPNSLQQ